MVFKPQTFHEIPPQVEIDDPTDAVLEADVAAALGRAGLVDASRVIVTTTGAVVTLSPDFAACYVAREAEDGRWEWAISHDRETVVECALQLIARMEPLS